MIKPQKEFPLLKEYAKVFPITPLTVFAFVDTIYTNFALSKDLLIHEQTHLKRQNKIGCDIWIEKYLTDKKFRLDEEVIAYRNQIYSIKDREKRNNVRIQCVKVLNSELYGLIINKGEAFKLLK